MHSIVRRLRERKLVQWVLAYLAGAWVLYQLLEGLGEPWGMTPGLLRLAQIVLIGVGIPVTSVLAWYHGEHGRQRVSGAELLIIAGILWLGGVGVGLLVGPRPETGDRSDPEAVGLGVSEAFQDGAPSIAVLPFQDLSPEGDQRHFSEGLSEEIINALSRLDLKVAGRSSTFVLAGRGHDLQGIARALRVDNVLEGSVRKEGNRLRINVALVEAKTGFQLWSEAYDRELTGVFAIQDDIARSVSDRLQVTLAVDDRRLVPEATSSAEAHEAYLRGRYFWNQRTEPDIRRAISEFQRAVALDTAYAEAHAGLADALLVLGLYALDGNGWEFGSTLTPGLRAARTAVSLSPESAVAHTSLGLGLFVSGEWADAERAFRRAIALNPGYEYAHMRYSQLLYSTGRATEAVSHAQQALLLDPVDHVLSYNLGQAMRLAGRIDEAIEYSHLTVDLGGDFNGWIMLAIDYLETGAYEEGRAAWARAVSTLGVEPDVWIEAYEAAIRYRRTGEPQVVSGTIPALNFGLWQHSRTGQTERYVDQFETMLRLGAVGWAAQAHSMFHQAETMGGHARYEALLEEARITW